MRKTQVGDTLRRAVAVAMTCLNFLVFQLMNEIS